MNSRPRIPTVLLVIGIGLLFALGVAACAGPQGPAGPAGPAGSAGPAGPAGPAGAGFSDAQSTAVAALSTAVPMKYDKVPRGCPACHALVDKTKGNYTIAWEAANAAQGHPTQAPDGTSMKPTDEVSVTVCLQCHAPGKNGHGVVAPLALMDIVHPAHMSSLIFTRELGGSCFSCHNVDANGNFNVLTEAVKVNDHGVPDPSALPIPGAIVP